MKRALGFFLALIMLLSAVPAFAVNVRTSGPYTYEIKGNGTITITDFNWAANGDADIFIPNLIDGYIVTGIGDGAFSSYGNTNPPDESGYFYYKKNRVSVAVTIPDTIKTIGAKAFWCANISSINIPNSVELIGEGAFAVCPSCQFKVAPNQASFAVIDNGLYNKSKKELIAYSWEITKSEKSSTTIPSGILSIGSYALAAADFLGIELPSTLENIGDYAFFDADNCVRYFYGNLPNLKTIGESAFRYSWFWHCHLTMPAVETIGKNAFESVVMMPDSTYCIDFSGSPLNLIEDAAFAYDEEDTFVANVFIINTADIESIGNGNWGLGRLMTKASHISPELHTIPTGLNPKVTSLPDTVTSIKTGAFTDKVTDFRLSSYLEDIAVDAFPKNSTFIVDAGSYAELWCSENGFGYSIEGQQDDLSWLN